MSSKFILSGLFQLIVFSCFAQAPSISYIPNAAVYTINVFHAPVSPVNLSGAVPAGGYGRVTTMPGGPSNAYRNATALAVDHSGNIIVSSLTERVIKKISPAGAVYILAGDGNARVLDGAGTAASFKSPMGIIIDDQNDIYVADQSGFVIRKVSPGGTVTTYAGLGDAGHVDAYGTGATFLWPGQLAIDMQHNIYVSEADYAVRKIAADEYVSTITPASVNGYKDGPVNTAQFNLPGLIAVDASGNIYLADMGKGGAYIRKITPGGVVSTILGLHATGPLASFNFSISGLVADKYGNLFIADETTHAVYQLDSYGNLNLIAGGSAGSADGLGSAASFGLPAGLAFDNNGDLLVIDSDNGTLRKISLKGYTIDKPLPAGLSFDNNTGTISGSPTMTLPPTVYTVTAYNSAGFSSTPITITVNDPQHTAGTPQISYASPQKYIAGNTIPVLQPNNAGYTSASKYTIDKALPGGMLFDPNTGAISGKPIALSGPVDYTITAQNALGVGATSVVSIEVVEDIPADKLPDISYATPQSYKITDPIAPLKPTNTGATVPAGVYGPPVVVASGLGSNYIATDEADNALYVTSEYTHVIKKVDLSNGTITAFTGSGNYDYKDGPAQTAAFSFPKGTVRDAFGNLFVVDQSGSVIRKVSPDGTVSTFAGHGTGNSDGTGIAASFGSLGNITIDNAGNIYAADGGNNSIRKISPTGVVTTIVTGLNNPTAVVRDAAGNLYVSETGGQASAAIKKISPAGVVTTFTGILTANGSGFNGNINGLQVDAFGNVFVAVESATDGTLIKKISPSGLVTSFLTGLQMASMVLDSQGNLFMATDNSVTEYSAGGYTIDKPLPKGLVFDPKTGIIRGAPLELSDPVDYTVTAHNIFGSSSTVVTIGVIDDGRLAAKISLTDLIYLHLQTNLIDPAAQSPNDQTPITYISNNPSVATVTADGKLQIHNVGISKITASQDGSVNYRPAESVSVMLEVAIDQQLDFPAIAAQSTCAADFSLNVTEKNPGLGIPPSGVPITYTNSDPSVATVSPTGIVHILSAGTTQITANQADGLYYNAAVPVSQTLTVTAPVNSTASVKISGSANNVMSGTPVTFTATTTNIPGVIGYQWQVNGKNATGDSKKISFTTSTLNNGDIVTCIATSSVPCEAPVASPSITMTILPPVAIVPPNTFTPNNDGINDVWQIAGLNTYPDCTVAVYSRYGSRVFFSKGYTKPWNGTSNSADLPLGTYYYVIELGLGRPKLSGYVTIVR